jgi:hypothetical protein
VAHIDIAIFRDGEKAQTAEFIRHDERVKSGRQLQSTIIRIRRGQRGAE